MYRQRIRYVVYVRLIYFGAKECLFLDSFWSDCVIFVALVVLYSMLPARRLPL